MDEYDPPSYEEVEEEAQTQSLPYKTPYKPMNSKKNAMKTVIKVLDVNEAQRDGPNPLFYRSSHN